MLNKILVFEKIEYRLLELGASWIYSELRDETLHIFQHLVVVEPSHERLVRAEKTVLACFCVRYDINHVIGTYNGHESDEIVIDGVTYAENYDNDYSASDKGHYLGSVVYIDQNDYKTDPKFVWEIKGTDEYIYVLFAYDGTIYKRVD